MLVTEWRHDMKHQKPLVGSEYGLFCAALYSGWAENNF
jgi:hypothetical protein